ncbi:MAG: 50S ribosomal protein L24 [Candidatus Omnitrophica bacterium]|nr:50S ribosomal protein L24 [Candidatus Omnitrophota bacterium]
MLRIRKNDQVMVMAGKNKGKTGKIVRVLPKAGKAVVENINVMKKAVKKSDTYPQGGYVELEKPLSLSNLMLVDKKLNQPTRFTVKVLEDGGKIRIAKKSGETL